MKEAHALRDGSGGRTALERVLKPGSCVQSANMVNS